MTSTWQHIGQVSAALVPVILAGCSGMDVRDYHKVPYCCDRTAGTGIEYFKAERQARYVEAQEAPLNIEPAAGETIDGDRMFNEAVRK